MPSDLNPAIFLIHSWSFLRRDKKGYEVYASDRAMNGFRAFLRRLRLDFDVITTKDLPDLLARGELKPDHIEDVQKAMI